MFTLSSVEKIPFNCGKFHVSSYFYKIEIKHFVYGFFSSAIINFE